MEVGIAEVVLESRTFGDAPVLITHGHHPLRA
jgi:hypothetical protein